MDNDGQDVGGVNLVITITDLTSDVELSESIKNKFVGSLSVHVIQAKQLKSKDITGASDPFVEVDLGYSRNRTTTVPKYVWTPLFCFCRLWFDFLNF